MKPAAPSPNRQRGVALLMLLIALLLAASYAIYRSSNRHYSTNQQNAQLVATLAKAKEALIAYAVVDDKRPGRLLCPDIIGDGDAPLLARDDCDAYGGWLPWKTLDLADHADESGSIFRYFLSPLYGGDRQTPPLNSDTPTTLRLDVPANSASNDIVAIIIATRGALDTRNGDGDDFFYNGGSSAPDDNDAFIAVTRQELMAAVEKRVANELWTCLDQHAAAPANSEHRYPWPAPFSASNFQGKSGSFFGQVPNTQAGGGSEPLLRQNIADLGAARSALSGADDARQQLGIVQKLSESLAFARNLFDALYTAATELWQASQINASNLNSLNSELAKDLRPNSRGNVSIINSERDRIRLKATTVYDLLEQLPNALAESGIDAFPNELKRRTTAFAAQPTASNAQAIVELLGRSATPHVDIAPQLAATLATAGSADSAAQTAAATPNDANRAAATTAANALIAASAALQATIQNSRINTHYSEISPYADQLDNLSRAVASAPGADNAAALAAKLGATKAAVDRIATGTSAIVAARNAGSLALNDALLAAQAAEDFPLIASRSASASAAIDTLAQVMRDNDDNLTRTSLSAATADFIAQRSAFASMNLSDTRARVPYASNLQNATVNVDFWAKIIAGDAYDLATQSKANPIAAGTDFASVHATAGSAYQVADNAQQSSQTAAVALQTYLDTPTQNKQTAASAALATAVAQLDSLLGLAGGIDSTLSNSAGSALPIIWASSRCDFLLTGTKKWWSDNQWASTLFYQIGASLQAQPGTLKVNERNGYQLVVIAAGRPLAGQNRTQRTSSHFFEGLNADPSRDGDASNPAPAFASQAPSATFNDRLAY